MTTRDPFGQPDEIAHATPVVSERAARGCVRPDEALEAHARGELELSGVRARGDRAVPGGGSPASPGARSRPRRDAPGEASASHLARGLPATSAPDYAGLACAGDHLAYRYEIERVIGKGSFAKVAQCFDHKRNERVAVKVVRDAPRFHKQVEIEVAALRALGGARGCVELLDVFGARAQVLGVRARLDESPRLAHHPRADSDAFRDAQDPGGGRERRDVPPRRRPAPGRARVSGGEVRDPPRREAGERASALARRVGDRAGGLRQRVLRERAEETRDVRAVAPLPRAGGSAGRRLRRADRDVWSPGCVLAELHAGTPAFPGRDEADQLARIAEVIGPPPERVLRRGDEKKRRAWAEALERTRATEKTIEGSSQERRSFPGRVPGSASPGRVRCATRWTAATTATPWMSVSKRLTWGDGVVATPGRKRSAPVRPGLGLDERSTRGVAHRAPRANASARGASGDFARRRNGTLSRPFSKPPPRDVGDPREAERRDAFFRSISAVVQVEKKKKSLTTMNAIAKDGQKTLIHQIGGAREGRRSRATRSLQKRVKSVQNTVFVTVRARRPPTTSRKSRARSSRNTHRAPPPLPGMTEQRRRHGRSANFGRSYAEPTYPPPPADGVRQAVQRREPEDGAFEAGTTRNGSTGARRSGKEERAR